MAGYWATILAKKGLFSMPACPDSSRVAAVFQPISVTGATLAIRKFYAKRYTADELVRTGTLTLGLMKDLRTPSSRDAIS